MCLYFYFHLYLIKQWEALASLPAIFPDGKRLDERAYPWLLNGLVRRHFKRLKTGRPLIADIQEWITIFLAWWVVPFTMMAFWLRYISRHDWWGTCFHIGLIVLAVTFAIIFYRLCALTLQGKQNSDSTSQSQYYLKNKKQIYKVILACFSLIYLSAIAFTNIGADFREKTISEKPANYGLLSEKERIEFVKGTDLKGRNLSNADMYKAFLVKADLRGASLAGANLEEANLEKARLEKANFQEANLRWANLQQANLKFATLRKARLWGVNLQDANLGSTNLQNTSFKDANLKGANLTYANLKNAYLFSTDLRGATNITIDQLSKVKTLHESKLDPELMEKVKRCCSYLLEIPIE
jgi:uncharacterized protein YjbI with pentapeptide repeats